MSSTTTCWRRSTRAHLSGAALDVFNHEPLPPEHPYWTHPRVHVTPHIAGATNPRTASPGVIDNIKRLREGPPLNNTVDAKTGLLTRRGRRHRFAFARFSMVAKIARAAWASPPSGRPGRLVLFQAIMSKCAHGTSSGTNSCR